MANIYDDKFKIISYDTDGSILNSLRNIIHSAKFNLTRFNSMEKLITELDKNHYDILILDFSIITQELLNNLKNIREKHLKLYIILLINSSSLSISIKELRNLSVQGYCEKEDKLEQLPLFIEAASESLTQLRTIEAINKELENSHLENIEILRKIVEAKDSYTKGHSDRVSAYSVLIGKKLNLPQKDIEILRIGGLFHDIGKIGIPDSILLKPTKLTNDEFEKIKMHPVIGKNILSDVTIFKDIIPIVLYHHEKINGTGYPYGLTGDKIPYLAKIVAIADSFDAMTSKRSYRDELDLSIVKNELIKNKNIQFDSDLVDLFIDIIDNNTKEINEIKNIH